MKKLLTYSISDIVKQMHSIIMDNNIDFETIPDSEGR